jgi:hypothetical protein
MQNSSIEKRLNALEHKQAPKEEEDGGIPIKEEARPLCNKCYFACQGATESEEAFNKLFYKAMGDALATSNDGYGKDVIDLDVVERMAEMLREQGINI